MRYCARDCSVSSVGTVYVALLRMRLQCSLTYLLRMHVYIVRFVETCNESVARYRFTWLVEVAVTRTVDINFTFHSYLGTYLNLLTYLLVRPEVEAE